MIAINHSQHLTHPSTKQQAPLVVKTSL